MGKKSKYYILENEEVKRIAGPCPFLRGVCSKCAIKLAKCQIPTISLEIDFEERQKILNAFLNKVSDTKNVIIKATAGIDHAKSIIDQHYMQQYEVLNEYEAKVDKVMKILDKNKKEMRAILERESGSTLTALNNTHEKLTSNIDGLIDMEKDTTSNYENIISKVNMESLQDILQGYEGRITESIRVT